jgi:large subunit ribosomal protein L23
MSLFKKNQNQDSDSKKPEVASGKRVDSDIAASVLVAPHISEKASILQQEKGSYVFKVSGNSNKQLLKEAIESRYGVEVVSINVINIHAKKRRRGNVLGHKPGYKKAIITLQKGYVINEF